jgi:hypothetical protein
MDKLIQDFIEVKDFLLDSIDDKLELFLTDIWDPFSKFVLIKELYKVIGLELHSQFPNFPKEYLPKVRLKVIDEECMIEKHIQVFFNTDTRLVLLASLDIGDVPYDLYYKKSYDPTTPYRFFAKYGHDSESIMQGSKTAAAEYFMGKCTPLSIAFQIAQEEGVV